MRTWTKKGAEAPWENYGAEEIIGKLRKAEVALLKRSTVSEIFAAWLCRAEWRSTLTAPRVPSDAAGRHIQVVVA